MPQGPIHRDHGYVRKRRARQPKPAGQRHQADLSLQFRQKLESFRIWNADPTPVSADDSEFGWWVVIRVCTSRAAAGIWAEQPGSLRVSDLRFPELLIRGLGFLCTYEPTSG